MPVCPKCGFDGEDQDTCERCGIIYARMHTILETRPAALSAAIARSTPSGPKPIVLSKPGGGPSLAQPAEPPKANVPTSGAVRTIPTIAQAFPGAPIPARRPGELTPGPGGRIEREVTLVPILPPPPRESGTRLRVLLVLLLITLGVWAIFRWRENRAKVYSAEATVDEVADNGYFDIRIAQLVEDIQLNLLTIKDPVAAAKILEGVQQRERFLRVRIETTSAVSDARKAALRDALDKLAKFLKTDVGGAIATARKAQAKNAAIAGLDFEEPPAAQGKSGKSLGQVKAITASMKETSPKTAGSARKTPSRASARVAAVKVDRRLLKQVNNELANLPP